MINCVCDIYETNLSGQIGIKNGYPNSKHVQKKVWQKLFLCHRLYYKWKTDKKTRWENQTRR